MLSKALSVRELARIGEAELSRRQRIADAQRGRRKSDAHRQAISAGVSRAQGGKPMSDYRRQAISAGIKEWWAERRAAKTAMTAAGQQAGVA
jgi:hypothetical protein